jgi:CRP-like cAMP-binding protein
MRQSEALIALLGLRRVEERVRGFLELLAQEYGQPCEQGLRLNLRLNPLLNPLLSLSRPTPYRFSTSDRFPRKRYRPFSKRVRFGFSA